jgi:cyanophycinase
VGAASVTVLHATSRADAADEAFLKPLREATGVWFGGGRQWRFVDAYAETPVVELCHDVLRRGGIIGGSSAGATIQGQYLVRGHPLGNTEMMAEGYEEGFGFLPGAAIDQHFTQRGRLPDLQAFHQTFPQVVGLGIDESTAILAAGTEARVLGEGTVTVLPARPTPNAPNESEGDEESEDATVVLRTGDRYDFATGRVDRADAAPQPAKAPADPGRDAALNP